ncbi:hypothetical protein BG844_18590 [Couchioplanes caeruleus subsp. caeruleus]|uniref:Coenzyme PQQ synthesis protein D (PqqD) n=1 Tax=Couchioplanes caeruleus subsp. caeruleus TaxID=56427 RepID=A0A1K0FJC3_9ACTN|nr:hypothetical protein BG844_18590 [Couchioplanes caeruleus subsp. caeruleus]
MYPTSVPTALLDVRVRRIGGDFLLSRADRSYSLSDSAAFIWQQIDGRRDATEIAHRLAAEYEVATDAALADTLGVLHELTGLGLLGHAETQTGTGA